jgi:hypothetical protein
MIDTLEKTLFNCACSYAQLYFPAGGTLSKNQSDSSKNTNSLFNDKTKNQLNPQCLKAQM